MKTNRPDTGNGDRGVGGWTPEGCSGLTEVAGDTLRPGGLDLTEHLLDLGNFPDGSRVLDAGCGMGATLRHLTQTRGLTAVGVDGSAAMLAAARSHSGDTPLVLAALERLPFGAASFDGIICECVLSQTDAAQVLAEFQRVLRPDGVLLVSDLYSRCAGATPEAEQAKVNRPATKEQTAALLTEAGFTLTQWEDRTRDLRQLAAQLIMAPGPTQANLFGWSDKSGCSTGTAERWKDVGYHLLVARRSAS